jgi:hypothetical protein
MLALKNAAIVMPTPSSIRADIGEVHGAMIIVVFAHQLADTVLASIGATWELPTLYE